MRVSSIAIIICAGVGARGVKVLRAPTPAITEAPEALNVEIARRQFGAGPDAVSLARILLTAVPVSLRQLAATDLPAVSSILWEDFLGDDRPQWFSDLPWDVQSYLVDQFGPATAYRPTAPPSASASVTDTNPTSVPQESQGSESRTTETSSGDSTRSTSRASSPSSETSSTLRTSLSRTSQSVISTSSSVATNLPSTETPLPAPPVELNDRLSTTQKIGLGVGIPFGVLALTALFAGCCFLGRRKNRKRSAGSVPPSSPGFIPRFAFQEKHNSDPEHRPLNRGSDQSFGDIANMTWDDDVLDTSSSGESVPTLKTPQKPIMTPALYHTHSSNRARGKRTSYTSLHSVAEVSEPDDVESPILGRHALRPKMSPKQNVSPRNLNTWPEVMYPPIKRKPVPPSPTSPTHPYSNAAADIASQSLLRETMPDQHHHSPPQSGNITQINSNAYPSPYSYEEDYGPEFQDHQQQYNYNQNSGSYVDTEDGLYGHTSLSRYPSPKTPSRTEWPLRTFPLGRGKGSSRTWDHEYNGI